MTVHKDLLTNGANWLSSIDFNARFGVAPGDTVVLRGNYKALEFGKIHGVTFINDGPVNIEYVNFYAGGRDVRIIQTAGHALRFIGPGFGINCEAVGDLEFVGLEFNGCAMGIKVSTVPGQAYPLNYQNLKIDGCAARNIGQEGYYLGRDELGGPWIMAEVRNSIAENCGRDGLQVRNGYFVLTDNQILNVGTKNEDGHQHGILFGGNTKNGVCRGNRIIAPNGFGLFANGYGNFEFENNEIDSGNSGIFTKNFNFTEDLAKVGYQHFKIAGNKIRAKNGIALQSYFDPRANISVSVYFANNNETTGRLDVAQGISFTKEPAPAPTPTPAPIPSPSPIPSNKMEIPKTIDATGQTDVTAALTEFLRSVPNGTIISPPIEGAKYRVDGTPVITKKDGITIEAKGAEFFTDNDGVGMPMPDVVEFHHQWPRKRCLFAFRGCQDIKIINMKPRGGNYAWKDQPEGASPEAAYNAALEAQHLFDFEGCRGIWLENIIGRTPWGDYVYLGRWSADASEAWTDGVTIINCDFQKNGRQGISMVGASNVLIERNFLGDQRRATFDIEPDDTRTGSHNIKILNNTIGRGRMLFVASGGQPGIVRDVVIEGNIGKGKYLNINIEGPDGFTGQLKYNWKIRNNISDPNVIFNSPIGLHNIKNAEDIEITGNQATLTNTTSAVWIWDTVRGFKINNQIKFVDPADLSREVQPAPQNLAVIFPGAVEVIDGTTPAPTPTPTIYKSIEVNKTYTRNNCASGETPGTYVYTVPAGKYTSAVSQTMADAQAYQEAEENGQATANTMGTCTAPTTKPTAVASLVTVQVQKWHMIIKGPAGSAYKVTSASTTGKTLISGTIGATGEVKVDISTFTNKYYWVFVGSFPKIVVTRA